MSGPITHGMNVEQVTQLGNQLKMKGEQIGEIITALNTALQNTAWEGPDAQQFKQNDWPTHQQSLNQVKMALDDFGQKAISNANAQTTTSQTLV